jgi:CO/xanthine dehydrogenase Mo-binding subunit
MLVKRVHPDMTIDANPSTSSMKTPEEPEEVHPRASWPEWLPRCTGVDVRPDANDNYIVSFCVTPKTAKEGVYFFEVSVDPATGETRILLDADLPAFAGPELHGH